MSKRDIQRSTAPRADDHDEGVLSRLAIGRLAATLYIISGAVAALSAVMPATVPINRPGVALLALCAAALGTVYLFIPWSRLPRSLTLWLVPVALSLVGLYNALGGGEPYRYSLFFVVIFTWIGLAHPPRSSLPCVPPLAVAYLLPLYVSGHLNTLTATSFAYTAPVCVLLSEAIAWVSAHAGRMRSALQDSERRFRALSEEGSDLVCIVDTQGIIRYASPSHQRLLGHTATNLVGRGIFALLSPEDAPALREDCRALLASDDTTLHRECRFVRSDGSLLTLDLSLRNRLADPAVRGIIVNGHDITDRQQAEQALRQQALYDSLTGLPNRVLLHDRLTQSVASVEREKSILGVLLIDLNHFKEVNDTLGHQQGDVLLQEVSVRLRSALRSSDTIARLGGDEFAVLVPASEQAGVLRVASLLVEVLERPFTLAGHALQAGASIGVAFCPDHGRENTALLRCADVAMYTAKRARQGYAVYTPEQDQHTPDRLALIGALREAISHDQLRLWFQPQLHLASGTLCGVEALVRWQHPQRGLLAPDTFIPLAEASGLIGPLTSWVLAQAIRQCATWWRTGLSLPVAVNLSAENMQDPALLDTLTALLAESSLPPSLLRLELTESTVMRDVGQTHALLLRLGALGVGLAIDDFGTGYSSLAYLKRLPVDELKIDKSFVQHITQDAADASIVRAVISLGHSLDLRVVAEGVEDIESHTLLSTLGCDIIQGYRLSRPLPVAQLQEWLVARSAHHTLPPPAAPAITVANATLSLHGA